MRKLACATVVLVFGVGLLMADEFRISIQKIDGNKITGIKGGKFNKETKKIEGGEEVTLTVDKDAKVVQGKFNKETKKVEAGDAIEGGLKSLKVGEKGLNAQVETNNAGQVTEIRVLGGKKKKDAE